MTATNGGSHGAVIAVLVVGAGTSDGLGTPAVLVNNAKTNSLLRVGTNSHVVWIGGDWSADADVTVTSSPGGGTQRIAATTGNYTVFCFSWGDQGAAGTTSYGVANASGTGTLTKIAIEIKGTTGGGASAPRMLGTLGAGT